MTVPEAIPSIIISRPARRDILIAAWEEDTVLDLLRFMLEQHGETERCWLEAIGREAKQGTLDGYRYGNGGALHQPLDAAQLAPENIGSYDRSTVFLSRTAKTLAEILALPPPAADSSQWVIGLWGRGPQHHDR